jgi:hypothetical protein
MFLIILPSMLVGFLIATVLLPASVLVDPGSGWTLNVPAGLLAGLLLGLVLHPSRDRRFGYLAIAAVMTVIVVLVLLVLAQLRLPDPGSDLRVSSMAVGVLVAAAVQTLVAGVLWWLKGRGPR